MPNVLTATRNIVTNPATDIENIYFASNRVSSTGQGWKCT